MASLSKRYPSLLKWKKNHNEYNDINENKLLSLRDYRISAWLQCQRTTIEIFNRIFSNALMICTISRLSSVSFLFVVCVNSSSCAISCVSCHRDGILFIFTGKKVLSTCFKTNKTENTRINKSVFL